MANDQSRSRRCHRPMGIGIWSLVIGHWSWIAILSLVASVAPAWAAEKPNVLFIAIDDLNDWVGCLGGHPQVEDAAHRPARGPRDALHQRPLPGPLCNPSRTSLLTGLRPSTTGVYALAPWFRTAEGFEDHRDALPVLPPPRLLDADRAARSSTTATRRSSTRADGKEVDVWGHHGGWTAAAEESSSQTPDKHPADGLGRRFRREDEEQDDWKSPTGRSSSLQAAGGAVLPRGRLPASARAVLRPAEVVRPLPGGQAARCRR